MTAAHSARLRWFAASVFFLISALNYLDRQILAALAPTIQQEFHLTLEQYGALISAFSIVYALSSPAMGLWIDHLGLARGASFCVGLWSIAGTATGLAPSYSVLMACRAVLGLAQAGGIPATGKATATYLPPKERALGAAVSQVGLSLGSIAAPLIAAWALRVHDWRWAFLSTGLIGLAWIPLGLATARRIPPPSAPGERGPGGRTGGVTDLLGDRAFWLLVGSNILAMTAYTLWTNWTTVFFVTHSGLTTVEANQRFAWMPPLAGAIGGFAGGWAAHATISAGVPVLRARLRIALGCALALLVTAAAPYLGSAMLSAAVISLSFALSTAMSVNLYSLPLDLFGPGRAGFSTAALTASYGVLQTVVSPGIGWMVRHHGFGEVCALTAVAPLLAVAMLYRAVGRR